MEISRQSAPVQITFRQMLHISIVILIGVCYAEAQHTVRFTVLEELPRGTVIGSLITRLPQALKDKLSQLQFRMIQNKQAHYFHVNVTTGELRVKSRLDRETICPTPLIEEGQLLDILRHAAATVDPKCELSFRVNVLRLTRSGVEIENLIRVFVQLEDIDDNRCRFLPSGQQELHIPENTNGTAFALNAPVDLDTKPGNNVLQSSIRLVTGASVTEKNMFHLIVTHSESLISPYNIQLILNEPLDYEKTRMLQLIVIAAGSALNSECRLALKIHVLDQNDHAPVFVEKFAEVSVEENTTLGQPIYTARATDLDAGPVHGALRFHLSPFNPPQIHTVFAVDEYNGSVYLKRPLRYYAQHASYKLSILVTNPNSENKASSAIDQWSVSGSGVSSVDHMDLQVNVIDVNDKRPEIVIYALNGSRQLTLLEHTESVPADFAVISVTDEDSGPNGQVSCRLIEPHVEWFELTRIDQKQSATATNSTDTGSGAKGALYKLAALRSFDRETEPRVNFHILCEDRGEPKLASNSTGELTILDINDHDPEFSQSMIHLQVVEDSDPTRQLNDYVIVQLNATDKDIGDNARLEYSLKDSYVQKLFSVDPQSGLLRSKGTLDYEGNRTIVFSIWATDFGTGPRSASIEIRIAITDFNDHAPEFDRPEYHFHVSENLPQATQVGSFRVCDRDAGTNAAVHFRLVPMTRATPSADDDPQFRSPVPFRLTSQYASQLQCYELYILTTSKLNREAHMDKHNQSWLDRVDETVYQALPYQFEVIAEDRGRPQQTSRATFCVSVTDLNDEAPIFLQPPARHRSFVVATYQPVGAEIFRVHAIDRDEGINGTVQYFLNGVGLYETNSDKQIVKHCEESKLKNVLRPRQTVLNLLDYFHMNATTGVFSLKSALPDQLIDMICLVDISARDRGPVPLETTIHVCLTISDVAWTQDGIGINRTGLITGGQGRSRAKTARATLYLYIIAAVSIIGLIASVAFVLSAYFLWHRPRSKSTHTRSNVIRFNDVDSTAAGMQPFDKAYIPPLYTDNRVPAVDSGGTLVEWPDSLDGTDQYVQAWSTVRYTSMDRFDKTPMVCHGFANTMSDLQSSSMSGIKPDQYAHFTYSPPAQAMYYHMLGNAHVLDNQPMEGAHSDEPPISNHIPNPWSS